MDGRGTGYLKTVCDYVHLNPSRAKLLASRQLLQAYPWSSYGQNESQALGLAGVGQPVPAEHAFGADGNAVAVGFDELEEALEVVVLDIAVPINSESG